MTRTATADWSVSAGATIGDTRRLCGAPHDPRPGARSRRLPRRCESLGHGIRAASRPEAVDGPVPGATRRGAAGPGGSPASRRHGRATLEAAARLDARTVRL